MHVVTSLADTSAYNGTLGELTCFAWKSYLNHSSLSLARKTRQHVRTNYRNRENDKVTQTRVYSIYIYTMRTWKKHHVDQHVRGSNDDDDGNAVVWACTLHGIVFTFSVHDMERHSVWVGRDEFNLILVGVHYGGIRKLGMDNLCESVYVFFFWFVVITKHIHTQNGLQWF